MSNKSLDASGRECLSQLAWGGGGCFESRRRTLIKAQLKTVAAKA